MHKTKKAKNEKLQIDILDFGNLEHLKIVINRDTSFSHSTDGGSKELCILFLISSNTKYMPIAWQSKHIRRVGKSILGVETLAMVDMSEASLFSRKLQLKLLQLKDKTKSIKIICKTDNSCLYDSVHSSMQILDKRLCIEVSILREMIDRKEITEIPWIPTDTQIANSLIKKEYYHLKSLVLYQSPRSHQRIQIL